MDENPEKRFVTVAMEKGFITEDQFIEAMAVQIENDLKGIAYRVIGSTLYDTDYITIPQVNHHP